MMRIKRPAEKPYEWFIGIAVTIIIALMSHFELKLSTAIKQNNNLQTEIAVVKAKSWTHEDQENFKSKEFAPAMVEIDIIEDRLKIAHEKENK